jgi:simple sugar transport system permease protein
MSTDTAPAPPAPARPTADGIVGRVLGGAGRALPSIIAPVGAILVAAGITSVLLLISGRSPGVAFGAMINYAFTGPAAPATITDIINKAVSYYLSAVAVAIGFRMGLFNIGVEGQYRLAAILAAGLGASSVVGWMPGPLRIVLIIVVAMIVGAAWAGIAALLKVYRGVSEVISTIMLNFVGGSIFAYLLVTGRLGVKAPGGQLVTSRPLPADVRLPGLPHLTGTPSQVLGFIVIAGAVGVAYWLLLGRTRFGFDLRAAGMNPMAAVASGVNAKRMVIITMLISGGVAGLVAMPDYLGHDYVINTSLGGLGFTGIAIALLGRNHPAGIALAALLWSFLDQTRFALDLQSIPKETIVIMQGITVLVVVVAYEIAARITRRAQQRRVGRATGELGTAS